MKTRLHQFRVMTLLLLTWSTAILPGAAHTRVAAPHTPASAPSAQLPGLPNFGTISQQLSRGGQPNPAGFEELKKMGIDIVVNLRHDTAEIIREQVLVQTQGMQYLSIPWRGSNNPSVAQIVQFLELLRANPDKKVFVHCERGAERTGVMVATYRMSRQHWTAEQALNEMELFGFRAMRFGHLKKFVQDFPLLLQSDPRLSRFSAEDENCALATAGHWVLLPDLARRKIDQPPRRYDTTGGGSMSYLRSRT